MVTVILLICSAISFLAAATTLIIYFINKNDRIMDELIDISSEVTLISRLQLLHMSPKERYNRENNSDNAGDSCDNNADKG